MSSGNFQKAFLNNFTIFITLKGNKIILHQYTPHIKFIDMNDENRFLVVIFVDLAVEQEERLLQKEKRLDSNSFESIVDRKVKLHAYLFSVSNFSEKLKKNSKMCLLI